MRRTLAKLATLRRVTQFVTRNYTQPSHKKYNTVHDLQHEGVRGAIREKSVFYFDRTPKTALIICKIRNKDSLAALSAISKYLINKCGMKVIIEEHAYDGIHNEPMYEENKDEFYVFNPTRSKMEEVMRKTDVIICAGGDGTILYLHALVSHFSYIPPILSFSIEGSLGFLLPHHIDHHETAIHDVLNNKALATSRMRLECNVIREDRTILTKHVLNEVVIHRGHNLNPCIVQSYINEKHFATCRGDGLLAATPTGSTGYNLSAMGPMVSPGLRAINFTPISMNVPLSFRPLVLPSHDVTIRLEILDARRGLKEECHDETLTNGHEVGIAAFDSVRSIPLVRNDVVTVRESPVSIVTFMRESALSDWIDHINKRANFNPPNI